MSTSAPDPSDSPGPPEHALLETAEQIGGIGSFEWDVETGEPRWSNNLFRIFGLEPGEITPSTEYWFERVHPDDQEAMQERMNQLRERREGSSPVEFRFIRADGALRHLRAKSVFPNGDGERRRVVGALQDVTEQRRAERQIAAHVAVSEALSAWESLERGAPDLLGRLGTAMDFEVGVLWFPEDRVLVPRYFWQSARSDLSEFQSVTRQLRFPRGSGLPGRAWESQQPICASREQDQAEFGRRAASELSSGLAFPATNDGETAAVVEFYSREDAHLTDALLRSLAGIGYELGTFLARRRGELGEARSLTRRELEVLQLAADGLTGREVAERLVVSPSTIKTHFNHIYEKLGVASRPAAVAKALRLGLIE